MRLTRLQIRNTLRNVKDFFVLDRHDHHSMAHRSRIHVAARRACRLHRHSKDKVVVDHASRIKMLDAANVIHFTFDDKCRHWAETDGGTIWLNTYHDYTRDLLYKTLLHEALHYAVLRVVDGSTTSAAIRRHELSERTEHRMMDIIDPSLL